MNKEEIDNMIIENRALVSKVVRDMRCHWDTKDEYREMHDAGIMGLIKGVQSYNKSISKPSTYLYTCIKHEICKHIYLKERVKRKVNKRDIISLDEPYCYEDGKSVEEMIPDEKIDIEREVILNETKEEVNAALEAIKPQYKEILKLRYGIGCKGYGPTKLAKMYGISHTAINSRIKMAQKHFKREYLRRKGVEA